MKVRAITIGQNIPFLYSNETILSYMQENLENFSNFNSEIIETFRKQAKIVSLY